MAKISLLRNLKPLTILHRAPTHMHWRAPDSTIGKFKSNKRTESKFLGLCLVVVLPFLTVRQDDKESEEGRETPEGAEGRVPSRWYFLVPPPWDVCLGLGFHRKLPLPLKMGTSLSFALSMPIARTTSALEFGTPRSPFSLLLSGGQSSSCALEKCQERNVHFWQFQFIRS